ncbi:Putative DNA-binding protein [Burkholderia cepacia]|nr:Putative DNA-binding protein [Burkholderia cepacia]
MSGVRNARLTARRAAVQTSRRGKAVPGTMTAAPAGTARAHDDEPDRLMGCAGALQRR